MQSWADYIIGTHESSFRKRQVLDVLDRCILREEISHSVAPDQVPAGSAGRVKRKRRFEVLPRIGIGREHCTLVGIAWRSADVMHAASGRRDQVSLLVLRT